MPQDAQRPSTADQRMAALVQHLRRQRSAGRSTLHEVVHSGGCGRAVEDDAIATMSAANDGWSQAAEADDVTRQSDVPLRQPYAGPTSPPYFASTTAVNSPTNPVRVPQPLLPHRGVITSTEREIAVGMHSLQAEASDALQRSYARMPWWRRMAVDDAFHRRMATLVSRASRLEQQYFDANGPAQNICLPPLFRWEAMSAENRVVLPSPGSGCGPLEGITHRWKGFFPPQGFVQVTPNVHQLSCLKPVKEGPLHINVYIPLRRSTTTGKLTVKRPQEELLDDDADDDAARGLSPSDNDDDDDGGADSPPQTARNDSQPPTQDAAVAPRSVRTRTIGQRIQAYQARLERQRLRELEAKRLQREREMGGGGSAGLAAGGSGDGSVSAGDNGTSRMTWDSDGAIYFDGVRLEQTFVGTLRLSFLLHRWRLVCHALHEFANARSVSVSDGTANRSGPPASSATALEASSSAVPLTSPTASSSGKRGLHTIDDSSSAGAASLQLQTTSAANWLEGVPRFSFPVYRVESRSARFVEVKEADILKQVEHASAAASATNAEGAHHPHHNHHHPPPAAVTMVLPRPVTTAAGVVRQRVDSGPPMDCGLIGFRRDDITETRRQFLMASPNCRRAVHRVFSQLPCDATGRVHKAAYVEFILDLLHVFFPSFDSKSNIAVAEDEWTCRGTPEFPDFQCFYLNFFDLPMMLSRDKATFMSEEVYVSVWDLLCEALFGRAVLMEMYENDLRRAHQAATHHHHLSGKSTTSASASGEERGVGSSSPSAGTVGFDWMAHLPPYLNPNDSASAIVVPRRKNTDQYALHVMSIQVSQEPALARMEPSRKAFLTRKFAAAKLKKPMPLAQRPTEARSSRRRKDKTDRGDDAGGADVPQGVGSDEPSENDTGDEVNEWLSGGAGGSRRMRNKRRGDGVQKGGGEAEADAFPSLAMQVKRLEAQPTTAGLSERQREEARRINAMLSAENKASSLTLYAEMYECNELPLDEDVDALLDYCSEVSDEEAEAAAEAQAEMQRMAAALEDEDPADVPASMIAAVAKATATNQPAGDTDDAELDFNAAVMKAMQRRQRFEDSRDVKMQQQQRQVQLRSSSASVGESTASTAAANGGAPSTRRALRNRPSVVLFGGAMSSLKASSAMIAESRAEMRMDRGALLEKVLHDADDMAEVDEDENDDDGAGEGIRTITAGRSSMRDDATGCDPEAEHRHNHNKVHFSRRPVDAIKSLSRDISGRHHSDLSCDASVADAIRRRARERVRQLAASSVVALDTDIASQPVHLQQQSSPAVLRIEASSGLASPGDPTPEGVSTTAAARAVAASYRTFRPGRTIPELPGSAVGSARVLSAFDVGGRSVAGAVGTRPHTAAIAPPPAISAHTAAAAHAALSVAPFCRWGSASRRLLATPATPSASSTTLAGRRQDRHGEGACKDPVLEPTRAPPRTAEKIVEAAPSVFVGAIGGTHPPDSRRRKRQWRDVPTDFDPLAFEATQSRLSEIRSELLTALLQDQLQEQQQQQQQTSNERDVNQGEEDNASLRPEEEAGVGNTKQPLEQEAADSDKVVVLTDGAVVPRAPRLHQAPSFLAHRNQERLRSVMGDLRAAADHRSKKKSTMLKGKEGDKIPKSAEGAPAPTTRTSPEATRRAPLEATGSTVVGHPLKQKESMLPVVPIRPPKYRVPQFRARPEPEELVIHGRVMQQPHPTLSLVRLIHFGQLPSSPPRRGDHSSLGDSTQPRLSLATGGLPAGNEAEGGANLSPRPLGMGLPSPRVALLAGDRTVIVIPTTVSSTGMGGVSGGVASVAGATMSL